MEIKVEEIQALEPVKWNYEEAKKYALKIKEQYESLVYTEETMTQAKSDRATLNKFTKAINDERIRIEKEFMKPFEPFKNQCKEVITLIDDAAKTIDKQVKEFELKEQAEKEQQIKVIFDTYVGEFKDLILFDIAFNPRWLNKTYTLKKIEEEINHLVVKTDEDMKVLEGQIKDEVILKQVQAFYFSHIADPDCLSSSLKYGMNVIESNKKLEELKQQQDAKKQENAPKVEQDAPVQPTEEKKQLDFRVWVTQEQMIKLKEFLKTNNIEYGRVE